MKKIVTLLFVLICFIGKSQELDTNYTNIFSHISDYRNYNEVYLTNMGQAKFNLFSPFDDNNPTLKNLFPKQSNSNTYTDVFYVLGSGKENYFDLKHHQKLSDNLYGKASLLKTNSLGTYRSQSATLSNFEVSLTFTPKEKRYNFEADFKNYKRFSTINGGVADSNFFALLDSNNGNVKTTFPVLMEPVVTTTDNNLEVEVMDINYQHSYKLSKKTRDSLGYFQLSQNLGYKRTKQSFNVLFHTGFFSDYNYDTTSTYDSLKLEQLSHRIGVDYIKNNSKMSLGFGQNYYEYESFAPFVVHLENFLYGNFYTKKEKLEFGSEAIYITSNGKYESFNVTNRLNYVDSALPIFNAYQVNLSLGTNQPELFYDNYLSNHYQWNRLNNRNGIIKANLVGINLKSQTSVTVDFESQTNSIYWDTNSNIGQSKISLLGFTIQKEFKLTNSLFLNSSIRIQDVIASATIEVPNFVTFNKLYFKGKIFKKQLAFDAGLNFLYYSSFYAKAYNPALDKFYVQDKQKVGNYLIMDLFAEFYLKNSFSFFMSINHLNSNLITETSINNLLETVKIKKRVDLSDNFGKNFLATTTHPLQDRAFKFGLKWRLFD